MAKKVTKKTEATTTKKTARKPRASKGKTPTKATTLASAPTEAQIRERAFAISRKRKGAADPTADWFQAEQELRSEHGA